MRLCARNKQALKYALYKEKEPVYLTDDNGDVIYEEIDGEQVPIETGSNPPHYDNPVSFKGNIQFSFGEAQARAFGVSTGDYEYVLFMRDGEIPITETSLIFYKSEPQYDNGVLVEKSADFRIIRVLPYLDFTAYLLKTIEK